MDPPTRTSTFGSLSFSLSGQRFLSSALSRWLLGPQAFLQLPFLGLQMTTEFSKLWQSFLCSHGSFPSLWSDIQQAFTPWTILGAFSAQHLSLLSGVTALPGPASPVPLAVAAMFLQEPSPGLGLLTQVWHIIQVSPVKALQVFQLEMKESQSFLEVIGYTLDIGCRNGKELLCTVHILFVLFQTTLLLYVNTF